MEGNNNISGSDEMKIMSNVEKSYFACFVDTDGTLTLRIKKRWFDPRIILCNTEERSILKKLMEMTGGLGGIGIQCRYVAKERKKQEYRYEIDRHDAVEWVLKQIFPFMKLKRKIRIAKLLMEYFDIRRKVINIAVKTGKEYNYPDRVYIIQKEIARLNKK